ncbi:hypothetical protein HDN1F_04870 [gamma proteobacterium HdN1]|nr:hypothetical protein HDN1F_04870 [gamma proteobacterium HdN1]
MNISSTSATASGRYAAPLQSETSNTPSHTVERGDTLSGIAKLYGVSLSALIKANPQIRNPDLIYPGDQIHIPKAAANGESTQESTASSDAAANSSQYGVPQSDLLQSYASPRIASQIRNLQNTSAVQNHQQSSADPSWLKTARAEIGQQESAEKTGRSNPRIIEYHNTTALKAQSDRTAWCASFVNWALKQNGISGTNSAAAKDWAKWGEPSMLKPGAVVVLKYKNDKGEDKFHLGFYVKGTPGNLTLLGGNQSDQVKESTYGASFSVYAVRMPSGESNTKSQASN